MAEQFDQEIIDDFIKQANLAIARIHEIINELSLDLKQPKLFEECGQNIDRIYGAIAMFPVPKFSEYTLKMKEMTYKCFRSENESAHEKGLDLIKRYPTLLKEVYVLLDGRLSVDLNEKIKTEVKQIDKLLKSYLHEVKTGGVAVTDQERFIFVYDKSNLMQVDTMTPRKIYDLIPRFFNAEAGFRSEYKKMEKSIGAIVINAGADETRFGVLILDIRKSNPLVPIFLVAKQKKELEKIEGQKLGVQGTFLSTTKIEKIIEKAIELKKPLVTPKNEEKIERGSDLAIESFKEIEISLFQLGQPSPFDIYVKLSDNKFVRMINAYSVIEPQKIGEHIKKGIAHYYILRGEHSKYLDEINKEFERILSSSEIKLSDKREKFVDYCAEISDYVNSVDLDKSSLLTAKKFVEKSEIILKEVGAKSEELSAFIQDIAMMEHVASVSMLVGLMLNKANAKESTYNDIVLTCLLHDIALKDTSPIIRSERIENLSKEDQETLFAHPKKGALYLASLNFKPALVEAVAQHHMRYDGSGYPKRQRDEAINRIAEIVGLAEDFLTVVQKKSANPVLEFKRDHFHKFSPLLQNIFNLTFGVKE